MIKILIKLGLCLLSVASIIAGALTLYYRGSVDEGDQAATDKKKTQMLEGGVIMVILGLICTGLGTKRLFHGEL
jgi:hypothetical protein